MPSLNADTLAHARTIVDTSPNPVTSEGIALDAPGDNAADPTGFTRRYEERELLGEGGMGEVHLCADARIGREVAMKMIRIDQSARSDIQARFLREARVQGQLEHPSIVPVYDVGRSADGNAYFTMKRVRGLTLAEVFDELRAHDPAAEKEYSLRKLLAAFGSVCLALEFAHARSVIHRDLKPGNVMLGHFGEVYVLDWGVAKIIQEADDVVATRTDSDGNPARPVDSGQDVNTQYGTFLGTLGYLSPEQFQNLDIDARSDVYSLGAILFEILTLMPLHLGRPLDVAASTLDGADARCSRRAPGREVPPELEAICVKATKLDPKERHASARQLYEAVQNYLDGDRDTEQRRMLAAKHAEAATVAMNEGPDDKGTALIELGRSLALDPENAVALDAIVGLLVEPPNEVPAEVLREIDDSNNERMRTISRVGMFSFSGGPLVFLPLFIWMGVKSWNWILVFAIAMTFSAVLCHSQTRRATPNLNVSVLIMSSAAVGFVALSRFLGSFVLIPSVAMELAVIYATEPFQRMRSAALAVTTFAMFLPFGLECANVLPQSYVFHDGVITVVSQLTMLKQSETVAVISCTIFFSLLTAWWSISRVVDALKNAEEKLCVQAWQLRRLVPKKARSRVNLRANVMQP